MKNISSANAMGFTFIDLQKTLQLFKEAMRFVGEMASQGEERSLCRHQAPGQEAVSEEATRCQMYFVNQRWLGGLLTTTSHSKSIKRLKNSTPWPPSPLSGPVQEGITRLERERQAPAAESWPESRICRLPDFFFVITQQGKIPCGKPASWASRCRRRGHQLRPHQVTTLAGTTTLWRAIRLSPARCRRRHRRPRPGRPSRSLPAEKMSATKRRSRIFPEF